MLVLSRSVGQSLIIGHDHVLTLSRVDAGLAYVTLTKLSAPEDLSTQIFREGESAYVLPDVRVTFVRCLPDRPGAWLGVVAPREIHVGRIPIFKAAHDDDPGPDLGGMVSPLKPKPSDDDPGPDLGGVVSPLKPKPSTGSAAAAAAFGKPQLRPD